MRSQDHHSLRVRTEPAFPRILYPSSFLPQPRIEGKKQKRHHIPSTLTATDFTPLASAIPPLPVRSRTVPPPKHTPPGPPVPHANTYSSTLHLPSNPHSTSILPCTPKTPTNSGSFRYTLTTNSIVPRTGGEETLLGGPEVVGIGDW